MYWRSQSVKINQEGSLKTADREKKSKLKTLDAVTRWGGGYTYCQRPWLWLFPFRLRAESDVSSEERGQQASPPLLILQTRRSAVTQRWAVRRSLTVGHLNNLNSLSVICFTTQYFVILLFYFIFGQIGVSYNELTILFHTYSQYYVKVLCKHTKMQSLYSSNKVESQYLILQFLIFNTAWTSLGELSWNFLKHSGTVLQASSETF